MFAPLPLALFARARPDSSVAYARYAPSSPNNPTQKTSHRQDHTHYSTGA